jgi:hypothetical protein
MKVSSHTRNLALSVLYVLKYSCSDYITDIHLVVHFSVVNWPRNSVRKGLMSLLVHAESCVIFTSPTPHPTTSSAFIGVVPCLVLDCCTVEIHT